MTVDEEATATGKPLLHVEVCLRPYSTLNATPVRRRVEELVRCEQAAGRRTVLTDSDWTDLVVTGSGGVGGDNINGSVSGNSQTLDESQSALAGQALCDHVESVRVCEVEGSSKLVHELAAVDLCVHVFRLNDEEPTEEYGDMDEDDPDDGVDGAAGNAAMALCQEWILPARSLVGVWESLIFDEDVPGRLLRYINTALLFSDHCVNPCVVAWNRVILLHGPPGTGKTSLCRALAQKLSIRLSKRYSHGKLIEINAHALFSKWFSESGRLVVRLFDRIRAVVEDEEAFVCILIDEVETLATARKSAASGSEPGDAVRVVNALLTQIDKIKRYKNVLIMATSNLGDTVDLAFVDRADIKQYVGPPSTKAVYSILRSCLMELMRVELIAPECTIMDAGMASMYYGDEGTSSATNATALPANISHALWRIAAICSSHGMSGRTLRKLPFLAHVGIVGGGGVAGFVDATTFMRGLLHAVHGMVKDVQALGEGCTLRGGGK